MKGWIAAMTLTLAAAPGAAVAQDAGQAPFAATTLNLAATGEVRIRPDLAVVGLGVQAQGQSAAAAFSLARIRMNAIVSTLRSEGVAPTDIQTTELALQAQYSEGDGKTPRRLAGYEASDTVSVRLHDLGRVGEVVDALVAAGANRVDSVSFQLDDPTAAQDEARRRAVKALQAKAELYAQALGYRLRRLVSLSEGGDGYAGPRRPIFAMRQAQSATPVEQGELTVSASVNAAYELSRQEGRDDQALLKP